jgi:hypothetical protein
MRYYVWFLPFAISSNRKTSKASLRRPNEAGLLNYLFNFAILRQVAQELDFSKIKNSSQVFAKKIGWKN